jgi:hypothetical protein
MSENENVMLIKELFAAFGRGDMQSALSMLSEDVDWQSPVTRTGHQEITWSAPRHGLNEVAMFFQEMGSKTQPEKFEIIGFTAQDDKVVVEGSNKGKIRSTGRSYEHDWVMIFTLRDGKIIRHRHYYDTADVASACR